MTPSHTSQPYANQPYYVIFVRPSQYTFIHYFKAEISFKMVQKIENHSFREGKSIDGCHFSEKMRMTPSHTSQPYANQPYYVIFVRPSQYTFIHYFKAEISFKMVQKIENHSFREGKSMDGYHFSVRMCEMISHISTLWRSNLWNVLIGHNTPSSTI